MSKIVPTICEGRIGVIYLKSIDHWSSICDYESQKRFIDEMNIEDPGNDYLLIEIPNDDDIINRVMDNDVELLKSFIKD